MPASRQHYGFVFQTSKGVAMVAWARSSTTALIELGRQSTVIDCKTGVSSDTTMVHLTPSPVIIEGISADRVAAARASRGKPLPWDGDYSQATSVSYQAPDATKGLHRIISLRIC